MDSQAPPSFASGVATTGGAGMLRRAWSEAVATVAPDRPDIARLLGEGLEQLEGGGRLDEPSLVALAEEAADTLRNDGPIDVARTLSKRLRRAVYEFLLALDAAPTEAVAAAAPAAAPAARDGGFIIGLEEVEAQGRPMPITAAGADEAALAELARITAEPVPAPAPEQPPAPAPEQPPAAPVVAELDDEGLNSLVDAAAAEEWSRAAEDRYAEIEGHALVVEVAFPPLDLDSPLPLPPAAAPDTVEAVLADVQALAALEPVDAPVHAEPPAGEPPSEPISLTPTVDNQIPITRREDFVVSDPGAVAAEIPVTPREDFVVRDPAAAGDVPLTPREDFVVRDPAAAGEIPVTPRQDFVVDHPVAPPAPRPVARPGALPPAADPSYPAAAEWLPAEEDPRQQAEPPQQHDPLLAGWSTVTIDSGYDPTPSFPSSRFDPRADQAPATPTRQQQSSGRRHPHADAGFVPPVVPGSQAQPAAWGLRASPRQQVLADRMARKRREEAVRAAYEAAQLAATLGEPDSRRKRRPGDLERLPDVEGLRVHVEDLLKRKKGAEAGSLLQRAAQEQGGRDVADLCIDAGDRCRALGQSRAATNCYLAAWRADPVYEAPLWRLSDICLSDREVDLAVGYLERIATLMRTRGDDEGALGVYRKIVTVAPDRTDIRDIVRLAQSTGRLV